MSNPSFFCCVNMTFFNFLIFSQATLFSHSSVTNKHDIQLADLDLTVILWVFWLGFGIFLRWRSYLYVKHDMFCSIRHLFGTPLESKDQIWPYPDSGSKYDSKKYHIWSFTVILILERLNLIWKVSNMILFHSYLILAL